MNKNNKIFDFHNDFENIQSRTLKIKEEEASLSDSLNSEANTLKKLEDELALLMGKVGLNIPPFDSSKNEMDSIPFNDVLNEFYFESKIEDAVSSNPKVLPELDSLDITMVGIAGVIATLLDILVVAIPKDMNYLGKFEQSGSDVTQWLKSLGVNDDGKLNSFFQFLENHTKVPFDQSINSGNLNNFYPGNHRMLNVSHDPLFGLIFGLIDMINGQMTVIDGKGFVQFVQTKNMSSEELMIAPLIWVSHIVSDICTKQGIPIPGSVFTQFLQFGSFGDKERNVADISRWMYQNGYDLRHLMTMAIVPASIEIIIRMYHTMRTNALKDDSPQFLVDSELEAMNNELKLEKMLFASHLFASTGNALKVFSMAGNPMAINVVEWGVFFKKTITILRASQRDMTVENIVYNRALINKNWCNLNEKFCLD